MLKLVLQVCCSRGCKSDLHVFSCNGTESECILVHVCSPSQEPFPEAAALLLRHPRLCSIWGYGPLLSDGGIPNSVCHVNLEMHPIPPSLQPLVLHFPALSLPSFQGEEGFLRTRTLNKLPGHSNQQNIKGKYLQLRLSLKFNIFMFLQLFVFDIRLHLVGEGHCPSKINGFNLILLRVSALYRMDDALSCRICLHFMSFISSTQLSKNCLQYMG